MAVMEGTPYLVTVYADKVGDSVKASQKAGWFVMVQGDDVIITPDRAKATVFPSFVAAQEWREQAQDKGLATEYVLAVQPAR